jgi:hypothetical protein
MSVTILAFLLVVQGPAQTAIETTKPEAVCEFLGLIPRRRKDGSVRSCVQTSPKGDALGFALRFYSSGRLALAGTLKGEEMIGVWTAYAKDGSTLWTGEVLDGKLRTTNREYEYNFLMKTPRWQLSESVVWCGPEPAALLRDGDVHASSARDCSDEF